MPKLTDTMEDGKIVRWLKREGEEVKKGEVLLEVETDKAIMEVTSSYSGVLSKILAKEGEVVPVGEVIAEITPKEEPLSVKVERKEKKRVKVSLEDINLEKTPSLGNPSAPLKVIDYTDFKCSICKNAFEYYHRLAKRRPKDIVIFFKHFPLKEESFVLHQLSECVYLKNKELFWEVAKLIFDNQNKNFDEILDLVLKFLKERGVEITEDCLKEGEEVVERDLKEAQSFNFPGTPSFVINGKTYIGFVVPEEVKELERKEEVSPLVERFAKRHKLELSKFKETHSLGELLKELRRGEGVELSPLQKTIAKRMESVALIPTFTLFRRVGVRAFLKLYRELKKEGVAFSVILAKVVAHLLRENRKLNAQYRDGRVIYKEEINVAIALALEEGLITPVLKDVDKRDVFELSKEWRELQNRAKEKRLKPEEIYSGTFTITNLGAFGVDEFIPLLNPPQSAILGVPSPYRNFIKFSLVCDHRLIQGHEGAKFLNSLKEVLEDGEKLKRVVLG